MSDSLPGRTQMRLVECSQCGSTELKAIDGILQCCYCQSRFMPSPQDLPVPDTTISLEHDIQTLLIKCQQDPVNRRRYAGLILDLDPTNADAHQYLR